MLLLFLLFTFPFIQVRSYSYLVCTAETTLSQVTLNREYIPFTIFIFSTYFFFNINNFGLGRITIDTPLQNCIWLYSCTAFFSFAVKILQHKYFGNIEKMECACSIIKLKCAFNPIKENKIDNKRKKNKKVKGLKVSFGNSMFSGFW